MEYRGSWAWRPDLSWREVQIPVQSHRRFFCSRCGKAVTICRRCDRGQRYCGSDCSQSARRESRRAAGSRYRKTPAGRQGAARRQRCYRERQRLRVTHHGFAYGKQAHSEGTSAAAMVAAVNFLPLEEPHEQARPDAAIRGNESPSPAGPTDTTETANTTERPEHTDPREATCHFCGQPCGRFTRHSFMPPPRRTRSRRRLPRDA